MPFSPRRTKRPIVALSQHTSSVDGPSSDCWLNLADIGQCYLLFFCSAARRLAQ